MSLVKANLSAIFFLSVTALMCFVLDHLLCPASDIRVVTNVRRHCRQMGCLMAVPAILKNKLLEGRGELNLAMAEVMTIAG